MLVLGTLFLAGVGFCSTGLSQPPRLLQTNEATSPAEPAPERTLEEWREDARQRLKEVEANLKEFVETEETPPDLLKKQAELLARLELTLTRWLDEQDKKSKLDSELESRAKELEQLNQFGLREEEKSSFRLLDDVRDSLEVEARRLARTAEKEDAAAAALDAAVKDAAEKNSARRQARERADANTEDAQRDALAGQAVEARLLSEIADSVVELRKQELANAKLATQSQQLRVDALQEKEKRLQADAKFDTEQLSDILVELDRQEDDLRSDLEAVEGAATRLKYLDEQWMRAQRQLDESTGDKQTLREEIAAYQLGRRELQQRQPLLRLQMERLADVREIWRRRQQVFNGLPSRSDLRQWLEESNADLAQLRREERTEVFEIEELSEQLQPLEAKLKEVEAGTPEAYWIGQQIESLQNLRDSHQQNLESIRRAIALHDKLRDELTTDSLAATARDRMGDLWNGVHSIWNYELMVLSDQSVTIRKIVTALIILLAGMIVSRALSRILGKQLLRRLNIDVSASATIQSLFYYVLVLLFALFALKVANVPLTAFTVLGGAVALGIGFGSQNIINNFISGLILLAERPVKVGDLIQLDQPTGSLYGNIEHIGARSTTVRTGSNLEIIVPNSMFLQNNVVNFTLSSDKVRTKVEVGVVYGSPTVTVTQLLRRAVLETGRVAKDPPPIILFKNFGDNALIFEVHFWIRMRTMMDQLQVESAIRFRIDQLFREEEITIAYPQRDLHLDTLSPLEVKLTSTE